jgi:hypothetical protein
MRSPISYDSLLLVTVSQNVMHLTVQNYSLSKSPMAIWWHLCARAACLQPKICDWYGSQQRRMEVLSFQKKIGLCTTSVYHSYSNAYSDRNFHTSLAVSHSTLHTTRCVVRYKYSANNSSNTQRSALDAPLVRQTEKST